MSSCGYCREQYKVEREEGRNQMDRLPFVIECGHSYCGECIVNRLRRRNMVYCPACEGFVVVEKGESYPVSINMELFCALSDKQDPQRNYLWFHLHQYKEQEDEFDMEKILSMSVEEKCLVEGCYRSRFSRGDGERELFCCFNCKEIYQNQEHEFEEFNYPKKGEFMYRLVEVEGEEEEQNPLYYYEEPRRVVNQYVYYPEVVGNSQYYYDPQASLAPRYQGQVIGVEEYPPYYLEEDRGNGPVYVIPENQQYYQPPINTSKYYKSQGIPNQHYQPMGQYYHPQLHKTQHLPPLNPNQHYYPNQYKDTLRPSHSQPQKAFSRKQNSDVLELKDLSTHSLSRNQIRRAMDYSQRETKVQNQKVSSEDISLFNFGKGK